MKFWDASALVPLLLPEPHSERMHAVLNGDHDLIAWWGSSVECVSALSRRQREGSLSVNEMTSALKRLGELGQAWHEINPTEAVRQRAHRLLRVHSLRAADSLQLAACLIACADDLSSLPLVCLDVRLADAARLEGLTVIE